MAYLAAWHAFPHIWIVRSLIAHCQVVIEKVIIEYLRIHVLFHVLRLNI
jgi:hypothetical protein